MEYSKVFVPIDPSTSVNDARFEREFTTLPHSSYEWEQIYCSFIRNGDVDGARKYMNYIAGNGKVVNVGNVSNSSISQVKYLAVSLIAVATRVAINSRADELKCYQLSDQFIQFLDSCDDTDVIVSHMFHAVEVMTQAVHDAKENIEDNLYYKYCREYISAHLNQKILVEDLAELCGLTPNYLSRIFKALSGMTITEYILNQRIQVAKRLLLADEHTTAEIASFLGFSSQSYFISCFKKQVGQTPRRWKMYHSKNSAVKLYPAL